MVAFDAAKAVLASTNEARMTWEIKDLNIIGFSRSYKVRCMEVSMHLLLARRQVVVVGFWVAVTKIAAKQLLQIVKTDTRTLTLFPHN